jgi:prolipoprotein diacylglyceryltransferase
MHSLADVLAGVLLVPLVIDPARSWEAIRAGSERLANSWGEWRAGPVRILNHGLFIGFGSFAGVSLAGFLAGREGPGPILGVAVAGLLGAGLWAQLVEGSPGLARPFGYYGGLLGAIAGTFAAGLVGRDAWLLAAAFAVQGPFIQAFGRLRCLANGCCHGRPASPAAGIRYAAPSTRPCRLAGLAGVPIHPTQTYSILWNLASGALLLRLWFAHASLGMLLGLYLILNGLGRFAEEGYRGEPQTPVFAGLHLYQWTALASVLLGGAATVAGPRAPAPSPEWHAGSVAIAAVFGFLAFVAMGVDFPRSDRRFARLA